MPDQVPYDPYNPPNQQPPGYPSPVATQAPQQGGQPPVYPPPVYNQYQQPPQPPKKNRALVIVFIVVAVLLLCCCLSLLGFYLIGSTLPDSTPQPLPKPPIAEPADPDLTPSPTPTPDPSAAEDDFYDTKKVGNSTVGFVEIPKTWVSFYDMSGNPSTQFSNTAGDQIISMYAYSTDEVSREDYAESVYASFKAKNAENLQTATVKDIPGYEAYQVYGFLDDILLVCWIFEDGQGSTHYISVEGPLDAPFEIYEIPLSFTLKD
jgi:hypothetical protein